MTLPLKKGIYTLFGRGRLEAITSSKFPVIHFDRRRSYRSSGEVSSGPSFRRLIESRPETEGCLWPNASFLLHEIQQRAIVDIGPSKHPRRSSFQPPKDRPSVLQYLSTRAPSDPEPPKSARLSSRSLRRDRGLLRRSPHRTPLSSFPLT